MRVPSPTSRLSPSPTRRFLRAVVALVAAMTVLVGTLPAQAADPRLERAQGRRLAVQDELDALVTRLDGLESEAAQIEAELNSLGATASAQQDQATTADLQRAARTREAYKRGNQDPSLLLLSSASPREATEQARVLGLLASRSRAEVEVATAARTRTQATAAQVGRTQAELDARLAQLDAARAEVGVLLAQAQAEEEQVRGTIAAEEEARRRAQEEARRIAAERAEAEARTSRSEDRQAAAASGTSGSSGASSSDGGTAAAAPAADQEEPASSAGAAAAVSGGIACPVGTPRSYSDTYGAPRSGGRRHKGVDILAPHGTPIYAYESGTITRMNGNRLGGISLHMRGDSGNQYYYTHLSGYVAGISAGGRVSVGQHIGKNGDTGNARGIPHLHWEVMPGGGGNVNPYPYALRACG